MKPAVLIAALAFVAGAGLVWLMIPTPANNPGKPAATVKTGGDAKGFEREASYEAAELSGEAFGGVEVALTGDDNRWLVGYRGAVAGTSELTADGTTAVRLPAGSHVRLTLTSRDYVYLLALPKINRSQVAVPGREFRLEFRTTEPGTFVLRGSHVCGPPSRALDVTVRVEPKQPERNR